MDGIYLHRNWGKKFENVVILVAITVNADGYREVLAAAKSMKADKASRVNFFQWLRDRGLYEMKLIVCDKCLRMLEAVTEVFPVAKHQRCTVHFYHIVFSVTPRSKMKLVSMLRTIHTQESKKICPGKCQIRGGRSSLHETGSFPRGTSALMLVRARLRHVAGTYWGNKQHMNMRLLDEALEGASIAD